MLITVRDASKKIGITSKQLYRLIKRGEARPLKIGERYYFDDYSLLMSQAKMQGVITDDLANLIQPNRKNGPAPNRGRKWPRENHCQRK